MRLVEIARTILLTGPEEVRFFGRIAVYALLVGTVYWFLSYETAGTVLLVGFGLCALVASLVLGHGARGSVRAGETAARAGEAGDRAGGLDPERPFVDESGRLPAPGLAPLGMGFGLAMAALGIAFGPWLILAGLVLVGWAGLGWLRAAMAEHAATAAEDAVTAGDQAVTTADRAVTTEEAAAVGPGTAAGEGIAARDGGAGKGTAAAGRASPDHGSGHDA